jgi:HSP20 family protein
MNQSVTRWQPFAELADLRTRFDRLFSELTDGERGPWSPAIDVVEQPDKLVVHVNVPGIKPEEIKIEIQGDRLTISGEYAEEHERADERVVHRERRHGSFSRTITLPETANRDEIGATCHDGVLDVTIPLAEPPHDEARTITPNAA